MSTALIGMILVGLTAGGLTYAALVLWQIHRCYVAEGEASDVVFRQADWRTANAVWYDAFSAEGALWLQPWRSPFAYYRAAMSEFE